ncbi:hypothetical protein WDZ92_12445 [Nostoc sp. NIES-2111]
MNKPPRAKNNAVLHFEDNDIQTLYPKIKCSLQLSTASNDVNSNPATQVECLLDTGNPISSIEEQLAANLNLIKRTNRSMHREEVELDLNIPHIGTFRNIKAQIIKDGTTKYEFLIGMDILQTMTLVIKNTPNTSIMLIYPSI